MSARNIARQLRATAETLEKLAAAPKLPESNYTLAGALEALALRLPTPFRVGLDVYNYGNGPEVTWSVWDGKDTQHAETLDAVVALALASSRERHPEPLGAADAVIDEAVSGALPF